MINLEITLDTKTIIMVFIILFSFGVLFKFIKYKLRK